MTFLLLGFYSLFAVLVGMTFIWTLSVKWQDTSIVDRVWGLAFVLQAWIYYALATEANWRSMLVVGIVTLWGVRLSAHIHFRNRGHGEDFRYQAMRRRNGPNFWWRSLFTIFYLQAGLAWIIGIPLLILGAHAGPTTMVWSDWLGALLFLLGFYFEAMGDHQLSQFKKNPDNKGQLLTTGLWSLTRHPNYFGDACAWWGIGLLTVASDYGWYGLLGPALMMFLLMKVSGVSLLEKSLKRNKPGYEQYIENTPAFFPDFRKCFKS